MQLALNAGEKSARVAAVSERNERLLDVGLRSGTHRLLERRSRRCRREKPRPHVACLRSKLFEEVVKVIGIEPATS